MQTGRLFEIVYLLMQKEDITAGYLSEKLGVSVRTVYRDLDILSGAGIPVYTAQGRGGGIRLLEGFVLDKSLLTEGEQNEMLAAIQGMKALKTGDYGDILSKLSAVFNRKTQDWIEIDFSNWGVTGREKFYIIKDAILQKKVITFDYYSMKGEKTERAAEPLQLWFKERAWFLKAYCRSRQGFRVFKLSRMKNVTRTDIPFERVLTEGGYEIKPDLNVKPVTLELLFSPETAYRVYDEFESDSIKINDDGSFSVSAKYPEDEWIYGYILSFGYSAEVIKPEYVKKEVLRRLKKTLETYEKT